MSSLLKVESILESIRLKFDIDSCKSQKPTTQETTLQKHLEVTVISRVCLKKFGEFRPWG